MQSGDVFKQTFLITDDIYQGFILLFNDRNILHTDEAYAQQKGFKRKVMHGNILMGFLSYFVGECLPVKNVIIHAQEIRFVKPVYQNDSLRLEAEISNVFESVNTLEFKFFFQNQENVKVAKGTFQVGLI